ncbi:MAG: GNAT family N-acetyltransferase [Candidatus Kryptoniota bacterium]
MLIRQANSSDAEAISSLLSKSFIEDQNIVRLSIENNPRYHISDMYVIEDRLLSSGIVGCLRITPFEVYARGKRMPMAGLAAVAVIPEARRRGIAEILIENSIRKMYEFGYPISMLYPFRHRFYKKYGYAFVGSAVQYELSSNDIVDFDERAGVRTAQRSDRNRIKKVFNDNIERNGSFTIVRTENFWEMVVFPKAHDIYIYEEPSRTTGKIECSGYVMYELVKEANQEPVLTIKELVGLGSNAHRALWGFIGGLREQVSKVRYLAPIDYPMHLFLREPVEYNFRRLFFEYKTFGMLACGFMLRVINVKNALKYLMVSSESPVDFTIKIKDSLLAVNSQVFKVHVHSGESVVEESRSPAEVEMDIETFSQIYSGHLRVRDAVNYGLVEIDRTLVEKLDKVFEWKQPFIYQYDVF